MSVRIYKKPVQRARKTARCVICQYPQSTLLFRTARPSLHGVIISQETVWRHAAEAASLEISQSSWLKTCCHCLTMRCMNRSLMAILHLKHAMEHHRIRNRYLQYKPVGELVCALRGFPWTITICNKWHHRSHAQSIAHGHFAIGCPLEPSRYLASFPRYLAPKIIRWWRHQWRHKARINYPWGTYRHTV